MTDREKIKVFKIGGNVVDNPVALSTFVKDFSRIEGKKILVHGGGKEATRLSAKMGIETKMIDGRRVTDSDTINIVTMVYAGLVNKRVVALLQAAGCDAIGLTGADGNAVRAVRRNPEPIDYGYVGDISPDDVNTNLIDSFIGQGLTPVFCAIMHNGEGELLNCNADGVASAVAIALAQKKNAEVELIYCFEKDGVLRDIDNPESLIPSINKEAYLRLKEEGVIVQGMIPKIDNAFKAIEKGVASVTIKNSANVDRNRGTVITA